MTTNDGCPPVQGFTGNWTKCQREVRPLSAPSPYTGHESRFAASCDSDVPDTRSLAVAKLSSVSRTRYKQTTESVLLKACIQPCSPSSGSNSETYLLVCLFAVQPAAGFNNAHTHRMKLCSAVKVGDGERESLGCLSHKRSLVAWGHKSPSQLGCRIDLGKRGGLARNLKSREKKNADPETYSTGHPWLAPRVVQQPV